MKPVLVIWHDAHAGTDGWTHLADLDVDDYCVVYSLGYLVESKQYAKKNHVTIAQSIIEEEFVDHVLHIPKNMVDKIINLFEEKSTVKEKIILNLAERNKHG